MTVVPSPHFCDLCARPPQARRRKVIFAVKSFLLFFSAFFAPLRLNFASLKSLGPLRHFEVEKEKGVEGSSPYLDRPLGQVSRPALLNRRGVCVVPRWKLAPTYLSFWKWSNGISAFLRHVQTLPGCEARPPRRLSHRQSGSRGAIGFYVKPNAK